MLDSIETANPHLWCCWYVWLAYIPSSRTSLFIPFGVMSIVRRDLWRLHWQLCSNAASELPYAVLAKSNGKVLPRLDIKSMEMCSDRWAGWRCREDWIDLRVFLNLMMSLDLHEPTTFFWHLSEYTLLNDFDLCDVYMSKFKERFRMNGNKKPKTPLGLR